MKRHIQTSRGIALGLCAMGLLLALTHCTGQGLDATSTAFVPKVTFASFESGRPTVTAVPTFPPVPAGGSDDVPMVEVPAGEFIMGSTIQDIMEWEALWVYERSTYHDKMRDEWPQMRVYLDTFEIDKYEVTSARYQRCVEAGVCSPPRHPADGPEHPVLVKRKDAQAYCQWVGKRLPTEAEWEKAARGSDGHFYPWGNQTVEHPPCSFVGEEVPIGSCPEDVSPYGVWDVVGGVREWVSDWFDPDYFKNIPYRNPTSPERPAAGSFTRINRPGTRKLFTRTDAASSVGVRCAYTP